LTTADRGQISVYDLVGGFKVGATLDQNGGASPWTDRDWTLDQFGNWDQFTADDDNNPGTGSSINENRSHNQANELTVKYPLFGTITYDDAGNQISEPTEPGMGPGGSQRLFKWDAWNRLVQIDFKVPDLQEIGAFDIQERARYSYYGGHQRATQKTDTDQDANFSPDRFERFYYDPSWRLLERRIDDERGDSVLWSDDTIEYGTSSIAQLIWGVRYIDELVAVLVVDDYNPNNAKTGASPSPVGPGFFGARYAITDRNFSVIGFGVESGMDGTTKIPTGAKLDHHLLRYSPYGVAETYIRTDLNRDGTLGSADAAIITAAGGESVGFENFDVEADLNMDGTVDAADALIYVNAVGASVQASHLAADLGNVVGYAGYLYDDASAMYLARNRWYSAEKGRWSSRDPERYVDGQSQFEYVMSSPVLMQDPLGLQAVSSQPISSRYTSTVIAVGEKLPIIGTVLNYIRIERGEHWTDYWIAEIHPCACRRGDNSDVIQECKDKINGQYMKFIANLFGTSVMSVATRTITWAISHGLLKQLLRDRQILRGGVNVVLAIDMIVDIGITMQKARAMKEAAEDAKRRLCVCPP
jgi:RHS repeat-associated protein